MATTVEEVLAKLRAIGYGTDTEASQILSLDMEQKRVLNTRRWEFMRAQSTTGTMTPGTASYALTVFAADIKHVDEVRIGITASENFPAVDHMDFTEFRQLEHQNRERGVPRYWTQEGNTIHFWPTPDAAYNVTVDYIKVPTTLTAKANVVQIPDAHTDILVWATAMPITFRERDWDAHNFARQMYAELLAELEAQYGMTDRQTTKHVVDSGWFNNYEPTAPWLT